MSMIVNVLIAEILLFCLKIKENPFNAGFSRIPYESLGEPGNHVSGGNRRADYARNVRPHGMHEEEVLRVVLGAFELGNTGSHRNGGNSGGTD